MAYQACQPIRLICPACRHALRVAGEEENGGGWVCAGCRRSYPVEAGVPRLLLHLSADERQVQRAFDFEHARYHDSRRVHFRPELVDELCADVRLPPEWFRDKLVLDAGCGSGRWSYALASMGARVVAVDLTDSGVETTREALAPFPGCAVYQASIFDLPFEPETFDFVVSWGVLHHTPDTRAAFNRLVPLVRPGGTLYIMVYERTAWRYRVLTDLVRAVMRRLPGPARYRACARLVISSPAWYRRISPWLKVYDGSTARTALDRSTLIFDAFDAYSPRYNHVHTAEEVRRWFAAAGFVDVTLTRPIRFRQPAAVARWGACGGAVHVRGVRAPVQGMARTPAAEHLAASTRFAAAQGVARTPVVAQPQPVTPDAGGPAAGAAPRIDGPYPVPAQAQPEDRVDRWAVEAAPSDGSSAGYARSERELPIFSEHWCDPWRGLRARSPQGWRRERSGAALLLAPNVAMPPWQLGLHLAGRVAPRRPIGECADEAFRRWLPPSQHAERLSQSTINLGGRQGLERHYCLWLDELAAHAWFAYAVHAGRLCQVWAVTSWGADPPTIAAAERLFRAFCTTVQFAAPQRDLRAALLEGVRLLQAPGVLWRRAGRVLALSLARPGAQLHRGSP
jgi:2-polyprenyl-3-methyl-5-hydroxy-6-metoxy-1,4-benzoquinol methylase